MQSQQFIGGNLVLTKAGLTGLSGAATTFTIGTAIVYALYGKLASKSTVSGGTTPTTDAVTGAAITLKAGYGTNVLWCLDSSGNVKVVQGSTELLDASGAFQFAAPQFANLPDTLVPFAYCVLKNAATGTLFTFGTSNWNQSGMTITVSDIMAVPNRPQAS
jgi:hypothetical protein